MRKIDLDLKQYIFPPSMLDPYNFRGYRHHRWNGFLVYPSIYNIWKYIGEYETSFALSFIETRSVPALGVWDELQFAYLGKWRDDNKKCVEVVCQIVPVTG